MTNQNLSNEQGPPARDEEISLINTAIVLLKHKRLVLGLPLASGLIAVVLVLFMTKIYIGTTRILPPQQNQSTAAAALGALSGIAGLAGAPALQTLGLRNPSDLYVAILTSRSIADRMIERFDLRNLYGTSTMVSTRRALERVTNINAGRDGLISIDVEDSDPKRAADMANAYVEELHRFMQGLALTEAAQRRLFFERELAVTREKLAVAEMDLRKVQEETGLIHPSEQAKAIFDAFTEVRARIAAKEVQIAAMRTFSTDANPDVARAREELTSLKLQLAKLESTKTAQGKGDILVPTGKVPEVGLEYLRRARELKYQETLFELLARQFEMAKIDEAKDAALIQVVDKAVPADYKSKPNRAKIVVFICFAAGLVAVLLAFGLEARQRARNSPARAAQLRLFGEHLKW